MLVTKQELVSRKVHSTSAEDGDRMYKNEMLSRMACPIEATMAATDCRFQSLDFPSVHM